MARRTHPLGPPLGVANPGGYTYIARSAIARPDRHRYISLLIAASWRDTPDLNRGQLIASLADLGRAWGCSRQVAWRYLRSLVESGDLATEPGPTRHGASKLTLLHYDEHAIPAEDGDPGG